MKNDSVRVHTVKDEESRLSPIADADDVTGPHPSGSPPAEGEEETGKATQIEERHPEQQAQSVEPETPVTQEPAPVHVAPNLLDLATGRAETLAEEKQAQEQRDLDQVVHSMLIVGLAISTALMLFGIVLEIAEHQDLPSIAPDPAAIAAGVLSLNPSSFLVLGLLVLLATPMLRVAGSIAAFAYERDWKFAGITFIVLMVVIASLLLGKG